MTYEIPAVASTTPISAAERTGTTKAPAATTSEPAVSVDAIPASPPAEVHAAMAVAAQAHDRLAAAGQSLSFRISGQTGRLTIEIHDLAGNVMFTVPPSRALEIAGGGT